MLAQLHTFHDFHDFFVFSISFFQKKNSFLLYPHENQSKFPGLQGWVEILMITLVSSKFLAMRYTVYLVSPVRFLQNSDKNSIRIPGAGGFC